MERVYAPGELEWDDVFFWGEMMGGAVLTSIPPVVIYILAQRLVVKGLSAGAVKG